MPPKRKREQDDHSDLGSVSSKEESRTTKDRECPFCQQAFTSSSLGRHLDLYIRPNNPKRPDGIHNVDEIRKIRSGITRRQPKGSVKRDREDGSEAAGEVDDRRQEPLSRQLPRPLVNGMDWRTTGVINEIRSPSSVSRSEAVNGRTPGPQLPPISTPTRTPDEAIEEQLENGRAAELALQEVLDSLAAARQEHETGHLWDGIDLCELSFPALCLTVLSAPATLFTTMPFAENDSWDIKMPTEREKRCVEDALKRRGGSRQALIHLQLAYDHWTTLNNEARTSIWTLEILRSFTRAKSITDTLRSQLSTARQQVTHLENEYELLSRCQLPRERMLNPPSTIPISKTVLDNTNIEPSVDTLLNKWKSKIRSVARPRKPQTIASSKQNYANSITCPEPSNHSEPGTRSLQADMVMHGAVFGVGGPMPRDIPIDRPSNEIIPYQMSNGRAPMSRIVDHG